LNKTKHQGISFDKFSLEKVSLSVNSNFSFPADGVPVDFNFQVKRHINKAKCSSKVILDIAALLKVENPPIDISVSVAGYFSVKNKADIKILEEFSEINAPAFIFPFAREIIANLTLKTGLPPMLLPPANIKVLLGKPKKKLPKKKKK
jgi:preprotein translocase subunit SecB